MPELSLTPSQMIALQKLSESRRSLFVTGGAGTGKSYLMRRFLGSLFTSPKKTAVLASTGAAAILLGGRTFHSFFGLGILSGGPSAVLAKAAENKRLKKRLKDVETVVIDEVSMLSGEAFDTAEAVARLCRESAEPWGGLRVVAVGDFFQLPPVSRTPQKDWAFLSDAWEASDFEVCDLQEVVRTEDADYLEVLNAIRQGVVNDQVREFLDAHVREESDEEVTHLFSRRDHTELFNRRRLAEIDDQLHLIETEYRGQPQALETLKREAPIGPEVALKRGAFVMLRMNDPKQRYVNGSTATVRAVHADSVSVDVDGRRLEIEKFTFSVQNADGEMVAEARNFPLSLAYASTIHKIQGATLPKAHVDLGQIWEPGQSYVALSRVRRARDLSLARWSEAAIKADPDVQLFYSRFGGLATQIALKHR
jgi:ATP-dependent exoDNAse (exonuclease V) alpha subunit